MAEKRSKETIDKLNEFNRSHNLAEVPYEHEEVVVSAEEKEKLRIAAEKKQKEEEENEAERLRLEQKPTKTEVTEAETLAFINKTTGKEYKTLAEALNPQVTPTEPTPEEIKAQKEQREANKLAFGLKTGKISSENVESFVADNKNRVQVVRDNYIAESLAEDPTLKEEDIIEEFEEKFALNKDATPRQKKIGEKAISLLAENIIREKHKPFYQLESQYSEVESSEAAANTKAEKMQTLAPQYKKDVEEAFAEVKKVRIKFSDTEEYDVEVPQSVVDELMPLFTSEAEISRNVESGWNKEELSAAAKTAILTKGLNSIALSVAVKYLDKHKAGTRGIVLLGDGESEEKIVLKQLTPAQEAARNRLLGVEEVAN